MKSRIEQAPPVFVALPNRFTLLASPGKDYVVDALKKNKAALKNKDMAALLERMNDKQGVSAAVVGSALTGDAPPEVKDLLAKVDAIGGGVTISDEIKIEVAVAAKNADGAKTIKEGLDGGLKEAQLDPGGASLRQQQTDRRASRRGQQRQSVGQGKNGLNQGGGQPR